MLQNAVPIVLITGVPKTKIPASNAASGHGTQRRASNDARTAVRPTDIAASTRCTLSSSSGWAMSRPAMRAMATAGTPSSGVPGGYA